MLVNAGQFIALCQNYRLVWGLGRFGGGKTSMALRIAAEFIKGGDYRLLTNTRTVWGDRMRDCVLGDDGMMHTVVVLDEGGMFFKYGSQVEAVAAYAAKMDNIYIIPSFWPPVRAAQVLTFQPKWSTRVMAVPMICYQWKVRMGGFSDEGHFFWWQPGEVFGVYSRQDPGDTADEIVDHLIDQVEDFRKYHGRRARREPIQIKPISEVAEGGGSLVDLASIADSIEASRDEFETLLARKAKSGRRR